MQEVQGGVSGKGAVGFLGIVPDEPGGELPVESGEVVREMLVGLDEAIPRGAVETDNYYGPLQLFGGVNGAILAFFLRRCRSPAEECPERAGSVRESVQIRQIAEVGGAQGKRAGVAS